MKKSEVKYGLRGFIDTHIHTSPDIKSRKLNDFKAAIMARDNGMSAIVLKSHCNPTATRAKITSDVTNFPVIGGITLNNLQGVESCSIKSTAQQGGKIVWMPTINHKTIELTDEILETILNIIKDYDMVLATGHLSPERIFMLIDKAKTIGIKRILINHPLTNVVGATISEQKEMARNAYLEHCYVACMPQHDGLDPSKLAQAIKEVGARHCIMATDFGQPHNSFPTDGLRMFVDDMIRNGINYKSVRMMCIENPHELLF
jgi:hypothetical protein